MPAIERAADGVALTADLDRDDAWLSRLVGLWLAANHGYKFERLDPLQHLVDARANHLPLLAQRSRLRSTRPSTSAIAARGPPPPRGLRRWFSASSLECSAVARAFSARNRSIMLTSSLTFSSSRSIGSRSIDLTRRRCCCWSRLSLHQCSYPVLSAFICVYRGFAPCSRASAVNDRVHRRDPPRRPSTCGRTARNVRWNDRLTWPSGIAFALIPIELDRRSRARPDAAARIVPRTAAAGKASGTSTERSRTIDG